MTRGQCFCATVRYEIEGPFLAMPHCHCSMCRKHHGAQFVTFAVAPVDGFRWISGEEAIVAHPSSDLGDRSFCGHCGSAVPFLAHEHGTAICPAGNLTDDPGIRPDCHMFAGSKASWHEISGSLPQHEAYRPGVDVPAYPGPEPVKAEGRTAGGCLCGETAFAYEGPPQRVINCHCSRCRLSRGAAYATNLFVSADTFEWLRGEDRVRRWRPPEAERFTVSFCETCGSLMPTVFPEAGFAHIPAGSLDDDPGTRPQMHIHVSDKAAWFEIEDSLPRLQEGINLSAR